MKKSIMKKWVSVLRSKGMKQTTGRLCNETEGSYCCLGVLTEIAMLEGVVEYNGPDCQGDSVYAGNSTHIPQVVKEWAGMESACGTFEQKVTFNCTYGEGKDTANTLIELNDSAKWTFPQIADFIEAHYKEL